MKTALSILALALPLAAHAQSNKIGLHVICTNSDNDSTGTRFCSEFRDAIARSPRYTEVGGGKEDHFDVRFATTLVKIGDYNKGSAIAMLLAFSTQGAEDALDLWSLVVRSDSAADQASETLADLGGDMAKFRNNSK